ncbi:MAG: dihydrodipicolinate synthase family protein, partial [Chloroflexota bacterium]|nr:dihydrodipicolinate synthase family protein [Chloroflexota bacterium]
NLSAETCIKLSKIENIIGVKEASGNLDQMTKIIAGARKGVLLWSGDDGLTLPILSIGGYGVISVISHLVGKQIKEMINDVVEGKLAEAAKIHQCLLPLTNAMFLVANPMPVKYAVNCVGFNVGKPRLPLTEPDEKTAAIIRDTIKDYRIDLPVPAAAGAKKVTRASCRK